MHSQSFASAKTGRRALISLTPLIDVVFILLVFFMLASSFLDWRSVTLDAPQETGRSSSMEQALLIEVRRDGLRLAGETLSLENIARRAARAIAKKADRVVLVRPDEGVPVQDVVMVVDALAAAGIGNLSLIRRKP
ncbi:MAG: biopolymer transporter ExbD [Rhodospirillaceae bacterium]|nr:biopolymer transporter ExbD [Rhodospirillaceae bacterium]